jgi:hypothetical protein
MTFRPNELSQSNDHSIKWPFIKKNWPLIKQSFGQITIYRQKFSVKFTQFFYFIFGKIRILIFFRWIDHSAKKMSQILFRSNFARSNGSGSLYRIFLTERLLTEKLVDRKPFGRTPFDRKAIWPKHHLTESPFNRMPFARKFILPKKVICPKTKFIKKIFGNGHFTENQMWKTIQMTEMIFDRKFIWPKVFWKPNWKIISLINFDRTYLTETPFDLTPFDRTPFDRMPFARKVHLTERSYDRFFF